MDFNRIFEIAYSSIPENDKNLILDGIIANNTEVIQEAMEETVEVHPLVECVDLLAQTVSSEEILESSLDSLCESLDTETINALTEAFIEFSAKRIIMERDEINEFLGFGKSAERKKAEQEVKEWGKEEKHHRREAKRLNKSPIDLTPLDNADRHNFYADGYQAAKEVSKDTLDNIKKKERQEAINKFKGTVKKAWNGSRKAAATGVRAFAKGVDAVGKGAGKLADRLEGKTTEQPKATEQPTATPTGTTRKRGRPAGSKNKPKVETKTPVVNPEGDKTLETTKVKGKKEEATPIENQKGDQTPQQEIEGQKKNILSAANQKASSVIKQGLSKAAKKRYDNLIATNPTAAKAILQSKSNKHSQEAKEYISNGLKTREPKKQEVVGDQTPKQLKTPTLKKDQTPKANAKPRGRKPKKQEVKPVEADKKSDEQKTPETNSVIDGKLKQPDTSKLKTDAEEGDGMTLTELEPGETTGKENKQGKKVEHKTTKGKEAPFYTNDVGTPVPNTTEDAEKQKEEIENVKNEARGLGIKYNSDPDKFDLAGTKEAIKKAKEQAETPTEEKDKTPIKNDSSTGEKKPRGRKPKVPKEKKNETPVEKQEEKKPSEGGEGLDLNNKNLYQLQQLQRQYTGSSPEGKQIYARIKELKAKDNKPQDAKKTETSEQSNSEDSEGTRQQIENKTDKINKTMNDFHEEKRKKSIETLQNNINDINKKIEDYQKAIKALKLNERPDDLKIVQAKIALLQKEKATLERSFEAQQRTSTSDFGNQLKEKKLVAAAHEALINHINSLMENNISESTIVDIVEKVFTPKRRLAVAQDKVNKLTNQCDNIMNFTHNAIASGKTPSARQRAIGDNAAQNLQKWRNILSKVVDKQTKSS